MLLGDNGGTVDQLGCQVRPVVVVDTGAGLTDSESLMMPPQLSAQSPPVARRRYPADRLGGTVTRGSNGLRGSLERRRVEQRRDADQSGEDGVVEHNGERSAVGIGGPPENRPRPLAAGAGATEAGASQAKSRESRPSWKDKVMSALGIGDQPADTPKPPSSAAELAQRRGQQRNGPER